MTALNKQALREEFQFMQDNYSDPADHDRQVIYIAAEALLDDLEAARNEKDELQQGFIANQEEAREAIKYATELKEQLARAFSGREEAFREVDEMQKSLDHTHRRRAIWRGRAEVAESNLEAAEKRIAELEAFISQSCYVFDGRDADISDSYIDASTSSLMPKVSTKNEGEPCRYCSDGSYSGLPGGACEHCMGAGLDNPAAGISVKGE
ncbi:TPA: hypothetical protein ACQ431_004082 [Citrobacter murliniae]